MFSHPLRHITVLFFYLIWTRNCGASKIENLMINLRNSTIEGSSSSIMKDIISHSKDSNSEVQKLLKLAANVSTLTVHSGEPLIFTTPIIQVNTTALTTTGIASANITTGVTNTEVTTTGVTNTEVTSTGVTNTEVTSTGVANTEITTTPEVLIPKNFQTIMKELSNALESNSSISVPSTVFTVYITDSVTRVITENKVSNVVITSVELKDHTTTLTKTLQEPTVITKITQTVLSTFVSDQTSTLVQYKTTNTSLATLVLTATSLLYSGTKTANFVNGADGPNFFEARILNSKIAAMGIVFLTSLVVVFLH